MIVVDESDAHAAFFAANSHRLRHVFELAVTVVVEEARAGARPGRSELSACGFRHERIGPRREANRSRSGYVDYSTGRQLRQRVAPLIAVARAERRAKMLGRDLLKSRQVLACRSGIAFALKGARQSEFRRSMEGVKGQALLKRSEGFVIFLKLQVQVANEIVAIGFVRCDFGDMPESGDTFFRIADASVGEAEGVPGVRILRELLGCLFECRACRL